MYKDRSRRVDDLLSSTEREEPTNNVERNRQVWYAVVGTNGGGLMSRMTNVENTLQDIHEFMSTKVVTSESCAAFQDGKVNKRQRVKNWVLFAIAIASVIWGFREPLIAFIGAL